jgi:hypothetical protein
VAKGRVHPLVRVAQREEHRDDGERVAQDDRAWRRRWRWGRVGVVTMESYRKWDMGHLGAVGVRRHRGGSYRPRPRAPEFRTMNRTIRLCTLAGSDGIAIPAPFVDVRRRGLFSSRVPSLSEKGTCSRSELEAFSLSRNVVQTLSRARFQIRFRVESS